MILIVRHGPHRGRLYPYLDRMIADTETIRPDLFRHIRIHETGQGRPSLAGVSAVVFWLADPLRELYPECYAEALAIADEARERSLRVINPPEALSNSIKSVQAQLWRAAGIPTPPVYRFDDLVGLQDAVKACGYPVIIRSDEQHAQRKLHVCTSGDSLAAIPDRELPLPGAVAPLMDVRSGFAATEPHNARGRLFHKKRLLVLGNSIRTQHLFFATGPVVSAKTCIFRRGHRARLSRWWRMADVRTSIRDDMAYWRQGSEHEVLMCRAAAALGLDFAAIDYSDIAGGGVMLWEANPYFDVPSESMIMLPKARRPRERVASLHDAIRAFLVRLLD